MTKFAPQNRTLVFIKMRRLKKNKSEGREDLGRLEPGAKADIVIIDLTGLHVGLIDDPIKTLVYIASQKDIETVIIDGEVVVRGGRVLDIDEAELAKQANALNQQQKMSFAKQNPLGLSIEELFPHSFSQKEQRTPAGSCVWALKV